jgi:APA family basic amino acid/polyamine antiporter
MMTTSSTKSSDRSLIRAVGALGLAAAIANIMVGGGIFRLPSNVATTLGAAAPIAYVVCALVMGLIGLCIAEAGSRVSSTGGPYAYVEVAFGPFIGYLAGVMTWMIGITAFAAVANVFIDSLGAVLPVFASPAGRAAGLIGAFGFLGAVNIAGVKHGNRLNSTMIVVKVLPLLVLVGLGVWAIEPANLAVTAMPEASNIARTSIVLLFAFTGVESALVVGGELKDPARTVPRGIFIGLAGVTVLYLSVQLVAQGVLGDALAGSTTPLADAAGAAIGPWGRQLLLLGVIISTFGYLSGMSLASPRSLFAFARDGFLPRQLASVHPRFHTPWIAVIIQLSLACTVAITSSFGSLAVISNVAALLCYFGCAAAAWRLRRDGVQEPGTVPFRAPGGAATPVLACVAIIALLTSITAQEWMVLVQVIVASIVIFFITKKHRATL